MKKKPREARPSNIWMVPADGSELPRPMTPALRNATSPRWSPDGKMIAFTARDQATSEEQERQTAGDDAIEVDRNFKYARLWVTNLSDRKAVQVTKQDFEINELAWSPKGDELALVVARTLKPEDSLPLALMEKLIVEYLAIQKDLQLDEAIQQQVRKSGYKESDAVDLVKQYRKAKKQ